MRKIFLLLAVLLTLSTVLAAPVAALPPGPYYYWGKIGQAIIELPSLPQLMIEALDIKISTPIAPHDSLGISIYIPEFGDFIPLVYVTDNEDCAELLEAAFGPIFPWVPVVFLEDESDLEIRARVTVVLNVPVVGVLPDGTEVMIPSFNMKLRGWGRGEWIEETTVLPDYTMWVGAWAYSATGGIIIDGCEYQIGEASVGHYIMVITENP